MNPLLARLGRLAADPDRLSDARLLDAFLADNCDSAFAALVRRHGPMVLAVCRRVLRHQQDAEDAFQATFLVLARRAADVWPREAVGSWLHGVAYRVALKARASRLRKSGRERPLEDVAAPIAEPPSDLGEVLDRVLRKLPEVCRAAIVACDLEQLSRKEAAARLGWTEGTLSGRLARARQLLASRLRRMGVTLSAGGITAGLGTCAELSARLTDDTVRAAVGAAGTNLAGVSAPVVALTEGVVRGMFLAKIKTAAAAVLAASVLGFGVWGAAGAGDGPGDQPAARADNAQPKGTDKAQPEKTAAEKLDAARKELEAAARAMKDRKPPADKAEAEKQLKEHQSRLEAAAKALEEAAREYARERSEVRPSGDKVQPKPDPKPKTTPQPQPNPAANLLEEAKKKAQLEAELAALTGAKAKIEVAKAQAEAEKAAKDAAVAAARLEEAKAQLDQAKARYEAAVKQLEAARKRAEEAEKAAKGGAENAGPRKQITVRVRPVAGAEQVGPVALTGTDTVIDVLAVRFKAKPADFPLLDVWVLRQKPGAAGPEILVVDLDAIRKGDAKTNHTLAEGDTVVIQLRPK